MRKQKIRALLVEDNEDDVMLIREAFAGGELVDIQVVKDGEEALRYLRRRGEYSAVAYPHIVLLDIKMPKKNGFEVLKDLKSDPATRHLPVLVLTTSMREEDVVRSYAEGACSYIVKPTDMGMFREVARQLKIYWRHVSRVPRVEGP